MRLVNDGLLLLEWRAHNDPRAAPTRAGWSKWGKSDAPIGDDARGGGTRSTKTGAYAIAHRGFVSSLSDGDRVGDSCDSFIAVDEIAALEDVFSFFLQSRA
jgi:hypothetical protein